MNLIQESKIFKWLIFVSGLAISLVIWNLAIEILPIGKSDFAQDWAAAHNFRHGLPMYGEGVFEHLGVLISNYHPPYLILLFFPLSLISLELALILWTNLTYFLSFIYIFNAVKLFSPKLLKWWFLLPIWLLWSPFIYHAIHGQIAILIGLIGLGIAYSFKKRKPSYFIEKLIFLASLIKLYPLIFLLSFKKDFLKSFLRLGIMFVIISGILFLIIGSENYLGFINALKSNVQIFSREHTNISLFATIVFLLNYTFPKFLNVIFLIRIDIWIFLISSYLIYRQKNLSEIQRIVIYMLALSWIIPTSWQHGLIWTLPAILCFWQSRSNLAYAYLMQWILILTLMFPYLMFTHLIFGIYPNSYFLIFLITKMPTIGTILFTWFLCTHRDWGKSKLD